MMLIMVMAMAAYMARHNAFAVAGIFTPLPATLLAAAQVMKVRHQILHANNDHTRRAEPSTTEEEDHAVISKSSTV